MARPENKPAFKYFPCFFSIILYAMSLAVGAMFFATEPGLLPFSLCVFSVSGIIVQIALLFCYASDIEHERNRMEDDIAVKIRLLEAAKVAVPNSCLKKKRDMEPSAIAGTAGLGQAGKDAARRPEGREYDGEKLQAESDSRMKEFANAWRNA